MCSTRSTRSPAFEVTHIGFSQQRGLFRNTTGKVTLDRAAKKGSDRRVHRDRIAGDGARRCLNLVKSEDFLNVEKFPTMTYKSADLVFDGDNVVGANGEFTMLGVTRPVALKVTSFKCGPIRSTRSRCAAARPPRRSSVRNSG